MSQLWRGIPACKRYSSRHTHQRTVPICCLLIYLPPTKKGRGETCLSNLRSVQIGRDEKTTSIRFWGEKLWWGRIRSNERTSSVSFLTRDRCETARYKKSTRGLRRKFGSLVQDSEEGKSNWYVSRTYSTEEKKKDRRTFLTTITFFYLSLGR